MDAKLDVGEERRHGHPPDRVKAESNLSYGVDTEEGHDGQKFTGQRTGFSRGPGGVETQDANPHPHKSDHERDCSQHAALKEGVEEGALYIGVLEKVAISPEAQSYPRRLMQGLQTLCPGHSSAGECGVKPSRTRQVKDKAMTNTGKP